MKHQFYIFFLSFCCITFHDLAGQLPAFHPDFPSALYSGMDNPIPIQLNEANPELVNCKVAQVQRVSKYNDSLYAVNPLMMESKVTVKLYYRNILVEQKHLDVLPPLQIRLNLSNEGEGFIKRSALLSEEGFLLVSSGGTGPKGLTLRLVSGGITIFGPSGQVLYTANLRDNAFNQQVKDQFKSIPNGSRIAVTNPRVVNQYNQSVNTEPYREWVLVE